MSDEFTLCVIFKNEEEFLRPCLASIADRAADIVVVDTGSDDSSVEIAREFTSNVLHADFAGDFSRARNVALEHVRTPWTVFLDADERFEPDQAERLPYLLRSVPEDVLGVRVLRYNFFATGGWYSGKEIRIFRNRPDIRYERRVNESVRTSVERAGGGIGEIPMMLNHFGHCRPRAFREQKAAHYMDLMHAQLAANPDDAVLVAYVGLILRTLGRFDEALEHSRRSIELAPDHARVAQFAGHVLRSVDDGRAARDAYARATELDPDDAASWNMLGVAELTLGNHFEAGYAFITALRVDPMAVHVLINQGLLEQAEGRFDRAARLFEEVAGLNRGFLHEEWQGRVECDPFRELYYETVMQYAGLGYHLGYCRLRAAGEQAPAATAIEAAQ
ncbi:MAG: glycosyltransferase [Acidimicrobiia bacterium]